MGCGSYDNLYPKRFDTYLFYNRASNSECHYCGPMSNNIDIDHLLEQVQQRLRTLREKKGVSVYQLGLDSGVDNSVIFRLESGHRRPTLITILKLLSGLGVTPSEFFRPFEQKILLEG